jgi:hypothetical protein
MNRVNKIPWRCPDNIGGVQATWTGNEPNFSVIPRKFSRSLRSTPQQGPFCGVVGVRELP